MERISIKHWAADDKPREKLAHQGAKNLSNAELIAILIGSGNKTESAVELCKRILNALNNDLIKLSELDISELIQYNGIGQAKAISILAALELGNRINHLPKTKKASIQSSLDAYEALKYQFSNLKVEEFWVAYLNRNNAIIAQERISRGGVANTSVDIKVILRHAVQNLSTSIILFHNHPSGNLKPSSSDIRFTIQAKEACKFLEISVLDHLIVTDSGYYSLADEGDF